MVKDKRITRFITSQLKEEALMLRQIITEKMQAYLSALPSPENQDVNSIANQVQALAIPEATSRLCQALKWMSFIDPDERILVWKRADDTSWKVICKELGFSRTTAWYKWKAAIDKIASHIGTEHF